MSMEQVRAFLKEALRDGELGTELRNLVMRGRRSEIIALASGRGYTFTQAEYDRADPPTGEVSDDFLEELTGGSGRQEI